MTIKLGKHIHYKGNEYEVIGVGTHSETLENFVVYNDLHGGKIWVRPIKMWNDIVEHEGNKVKRFTHIDDIESFATSNLLCNINDNSTPNEKIDFFISMFAGRNDVYAERWTSKKGICGYSPVCYNFWKNICPKKDNKKIKCGECKNQDFAPYNTKVVEKHLLGDIVAGVYPMLHDETCRFLVFDFDANEYKTNDLIRDVTAVRESCSEKGISVGIERSRSGNGFHVWLFFSENIPVSIARKFGSGLITYTMDKNHKLSFETYDRMFPSQDIMPTGGFGNLIALPLQKIPRKQNNSVFVDENLIAYADQWSFLSSIRKYTLSEVESLIRQLAPNDELGQLHKDSEDEKPWERTKKEQKLSKFDFPDNVSIVRANGVFIKKSGLSSSALNALKRLAAFRNPDFYKAQAMRLPTYKKPRVISCSDETELYLCLPRGFESKAVSLLNMYNVDVSIIDEKNSGRTIDVTFNAKLRYEQKAAADALLAHDNGVLSATTAFGKTVIGAYLIAERKVNVLILVHRTTLLAQWIKQLGEFLIIDEEPDVELTPKGRKRRKTIIGQIGGGKTNLSGIIDVAVMQSLISEDDVKDFVKNYGMVIVDECHHVSAFTFEKILKCVNAKYVYGLTATPTRQDGHHPILYMQCGNIRYRVDAKEQAEARPFEHYLIPRFTKFRKPLHREEEKWNITDIYTDIQNSEVRNNQIIQDVISSVENGRNPLILTERKEHVIYLEEQLKPFIKNTIALMGSESQKKSREALKAVADIPKDETFVLVATGKYIGEGFDMPRLDTLFLTMPISWKGTVQQYTGRLHRLFHEKEEVQVYDYVDINVPMLENMYQKRLKGYAAIGYKAKGSGELIDEVNSIFDNHTYFSVYSTDIQNAQKEILIASPNLTKRRVTSFINSIASSSAKMSVIIKSPDSYAEKDRNRISECIELLTKYDINIIIKEQLHQKFAIIDQRIVWYGSISLLGFGTIDASILRLDNTDIAAELQSSI